MEIQTIPFQRKFLFTLMTLGMLLSVMLPLTELLLRASGIGAPCPAQNPKIFRPDPIIGSHLKENWQGTYVGVEVRTNSLGMRGNDVPAKATGEYRILCAGDSFAFGFGLKEAETLSSQLDSVCHQKNLPQARALNAGTPGYNLIQEITWCTRFGFDLRPDVILLCVVPNDLECPLILGDSREQSGCRTWAKEAADKGQAVEVWGAKTFYLCTLLQRTLKNYTLASSSLAQDFFTFYNQSLFETPQWEETQNALIRFRDECASRAVDLKMVLYPVPIRIGSQPFKTFYERMEGFCQESRIPVLSPYREWALRYSEEELRLHPDDPHPNALANQLMAAFLCDHLFKPS